MWNLTAVMTHDRRCGGNTVTVTALDETPNNIGDMAKE